MKKGRQVRSMRGEKVDFDLMEIKAQIASQPKTTEVKAREDFIETRLRRRAKRRLDRNKTDLENTTNVSETTDLTDHEKQVAKQIEKHHDVDGEAEVRLLKEQDKVVKDPYASVENKEEIKPKTRRIKKKNTKD